jgi:hypothetical protein
MTVVTFVPASFKARYAEFAGVSDLTLEAFFADAGLYLSNTDASPVQNVARRTSLLWMLTAHLAYLGGVLSADGMPKPVGRVSQAAEGSVSASFDDVPATPGSGAWFRQTQYGASFWQATSSLRGFRYVSCPTVY